MAHCHRTRVVQIYIPFYNQALVNWFILFIAHWQDIICLCVGSTMIIVSSVAAKIKEMHDQFLEQSQLSFTEVCFLFHVMNMNIAIMYDMAYQAFITVRSSNI